MVQIILRGMFILTSAVVAALYALSLLESEQFTFSQVAVVIGLAIVTPLVIITVDWLTPRKRLSAVSGVFLGLVVGLIAAYALSFLVDFVGTVYPGISKTLLQGVKVFIGVACVYGSISLVIQTKDDFRFVLPYIEFSKQVRGTRPMLLDSSAIIDGRILDIAETRVIQGLLVVPRFVLNELQTIADSADKIKRARGRRGLDIVAKLQSDPHLELTIQDAESEGATVDQKLVALAQDLHACLVTTDYNLNKVAELRGVEVININQLAEAMRPVVLPGELMSVRIVKPGESPGQGVGYLEDGTMVVVEQSRNMIGQDVQLSITSVLQTSAGRMLFGRPVDAPPTNKHSDETNTAPADHP